MRSAIIWMLVSYFIGSLPTGYLAARLFRGVDIRAVGSGNIGATNVRRLMGLGWAVGVTIVDMLKGALALLVTANAALPTPLMLSLSAFAVVMGHNFPLWLRFRGGKGVATTYGTVFFLWPYESFAVTLMSGAIWYAVMRSTRYVSLASLASLWAMPLFFWMLDAPLPFILLTLLLALFSLYRHRGNIVRLLHGKENAL
ncbi:MAG: glycerol-3-phosphate 1-O-acyltransferase PlsY [Fretibacterium sp.]|nr:glycerol-3-phosphate 1-O-acyltransferase PlsY [Fretibacterium sp.]